MRTSIKLLGGAALAAAAAVGVRRLTATSTERTPTSSDCPKAFELSDGALSDVPADAPAAPEVDIEPGDIETVDDIRGGPARSAVAEQLDAAVSPEANRIYIQRVEMYECSYCGSQAAMVADIDHEDGCPGGESQ